MSKNGIPFDGPLISDGEIHRFSRDSKRSQPDEWYVCYEGMSIKDNPYLICCYGTWSGNQERFVYKSYENLPQSSPERHQLEEEYRKRKKHQESLLQKEQEKRVARANEIWEESSNQDHCQGHSSYLEQKKIKPYDIKYRVEREGSPVIVIPLRNTEEELQGVQCIYEDGKKRIYGLKKGNFHVIGSLEGSSKVYVVEGYATGASVHEATKCPVIVAFDCGNLKPVIASFRKKYPRAKITIAADNDDGNAQNPGKTKAEEAAKEYDCEVVLPAFTKEMQSTCRLTDFNDLHVHCGIDEVLKQLSSIKTSLQVLTANELLLMNIKPKKLIIDPWLPEKGLAMIYAERGIGKTYLSLTIAYAVACGEPVCKWKIPEARKVLYIDGEMPGEALQERLRSISKMFKNTPPEDSYFRIFSQDFQPDGIRDLGTFLGQEDVNELISDTDVIILDNLSTLIRSGKENEAESWLLVQEWVLALRRQGKSVIFIHHAGKNGTSRGTSKREDVLDTVIKLKKPGNYAPEDGARFEIHFEKSRGFFGIDAEPFEARLKTNTDNSIEWSCSKVDGYEVEILAELYMDGMTKQRDLAKEMGISVGKVNKLVKEAKENGLLK
ncbi:AAA family ATPase [Waddlia chondrophila]|nr:AAA family ATPase [Waddlia chondrophila]